MNRRTRISHHISPSSPVISATVAILLLLSCVLSGDEPAPLVRVGLTSSIGKPPLLTVYAKGLFEITDAPSKDTVAIPKDRQVTFSAKGSRIEVEVGDDAPRSFKGPLRLIPKDDDTVFEIVCPSARYGRYRGILEIRPGPALSVVNELPLEDYVRGVIPTEVPAGFHPEAQKALTVAIRTYALKSLDRHKWQGYNLCDAIHCQGFAGAAKESAWADKLTDETRGQIIVYKDEPIYAVYSSDCGGVTRNNEDAGFGSRPWPYLRSVVDGQPPAASPSMDSGRGSQPSAANNLPSPRLRRTSPQSSFAKASEDKSEIQDPKSEDYCAGGPYHTWSKTFTADELARVFAKLSSANIGKLESVEFAEYDCSGRVRTLIIKGDRGEHRISGNRFRELLGESTIKSTRMTLTVSPEGEYVIEGKGFGHGVGLCSFGANGLAKSREGITYVDILKHYYTGTEVKTIEDARVKF